MQEPVAVEASGRELAAVGVDRQLAVARDARATVDERAALPHLAEAERLDPRHRDEREPVVGLEQLHVARLQVGAGPHLRGRVAVRHRREVVELVPRRAAVNRRTDRLDPQRRLAQILGAVDARHDDRGAAVAGNVAVVEAERRRDHAGREVVVHRHRRGVDRLRVERRVAARVERDPRQLLARRAVLVEVALREHRDPDRGRRRGEHEVPLHEPAGLEAAAASPTGHHRGAALLALRAALEHAAEAQDVVRETRRDREARVDHRTELPRRLEPAVVPTAVEPQRVDHVVGAGAAEPGRRAHRARVGRQAVDLGGREARVLDRREARVEGELHRIAPETAADVGLPDAADARAALDDLVGVERHACSGRARRAGSTRRPRDRDGART